ncbi:hypothetical protein CpecG_0538 [Chlamydia pecorum MC/MarsBar]|nr:hypothetical protein CpecF_0538 [Chlamydia pecorum DBDeUG]ETF38884.1 hypothetical protein CpecG_0538 [Chlamydia pecorum MC/MarsBar]ETF40376.1 hypothetical protein CpecA_0539 [Chlamydia pecorum IPTaLE]
MALNSFPLILENKGFLNATEREALAFIFSFLL